MPDYRVRVDHTGGTTFIVPCGELDVASAPELEDIARQACAENPRELVLDLRELEFMDSTGLRCVLLLRELCDEAHCRFALVQGPPHIRRVLRTAGVLDVLPFRGEDTPAD